MSRHRYVKNLNLDEELDDDALSDGGEDEITQEQHMQLIDALERVREVVGEEDISGLPDSEVRDTIWYYNFDLEDTIRWCLQESGKRRAARERQGLNSMDFPPHDGNERPRIPLIYLAQQRLAEQQQGQWEQYEDEPEEIQPGDPVVPTLHSKRSLLSTITEKTERTEPSLYWRHRAPSATSGTSYGEVIDTGRFDQMSGSPVVDPNTIPLSPSESAVNRLSVYEPAPSWETTTTGSSVSSPPRPPSEPVPPIETIPEIPDSTSRSTHPTTQKSAKPSKLAQLASSRASARTKSTTSVVSTKESSESVNTYPVLRPAEQSNRPLSSSTIPQSTAPSSTSFHVDKAIQIAMDMEAKDRTTPRPQIDKPLPKTPSIVSRATSRSMAVPTPRPSAPTPSKVLEQPSTTESPSSAKAKGAKGPSKLALLAQEKAAKAAKTDVKNALRAPIAKPPPQDHLPQERTEYLTPIANGASVTTAITTSYQTLYSLTDPSRPTTAEAPHVVPLPAHDYIQSSSKPSKLAMKIKKAQEKHVAPTVSEETSSPYIVPSMFLPQSTRSRASPSAFASLLVDDELFKESLREDKGRRRKSSTVTSSSVASPSSITTTDTESRSSTPLRRHSTRKHRPPIPGIAAPSGFTFNVPSPDDIVFNARPAKEREKAKRLEAARNAPKTGKGTPSKVPTTPTKAALKSGVSTPRKGVDQQALDLSALNLTEKEEKPAVEEPPPKLTYEREKLLEEAKKAIDVEGKKGVSLVVIGHVDAGKSTLMGRLLYELGRLDEKTRIANERGSTKAGKSSFSWAWGLDGTNEERERGITMDIALQSLTTPNRQITILDAPGHKDFIPNMISGASQADCALLVVDAATGEFEAGFERGGQTREHILLVRSLGVSQVIVAINKLDQVQWSKARYTEICDYLRPFLVQSGFHPSKTKFVPVGAMLGVNLVSREGDAGAELRQWYDGPTLVDYLDRLEPPTRDIYSPLRIPISNVFKGQGSGMWISGRVCSGVVQVGDRLRVLPGDESAIVRGEYTHSNFLGQPLISLIAITIEEENVPWAAAGSSVTIQLTSIDPVHLNIGSVLCPPDEVVPLATIFTARIIVFDIQIPITSGTSIELFHHSRDVPATISNLIATLDRASGTVIKKKPRSVLPVDGQQLKTDSHINSVLTKGASAEVQIVLRTTSLSGPSIARPIPLEPFSVNKDMGRILLRRGGETIGAAAVLGLGVAASCYFFLPDVYRGAPTLENETLSPSHFTPCTVSSNEDSGPDTRLITVTVPPKSLPSLPPQPIWSVFIKDDDIQVERPYTPLEGLDAGGRMRFWIKKYPKGEVGRWLHSKTVGEEVELRGPLQTWLWKEGVWDEVVMISGGTGITPFYQLFHNIILPNTSTSSTTRFTLLHSNRTPAELPPDAILGPLRSYAKENPDRFRLHLFVDSAESQGSRADLQVGRIGKAQILGSLWNDSSKPSLWQRMFGGTQADLRERKILFLVCGPEPMISAIAGPYGRNFSQGQVGGALAELGCSTEQVYKL
ncbi:hypothetical protein VNI00_000982 [Paramarasmius palmivorus]|uniref:Elongation factor 1 alpha-like protein n=1 Tax=Paramarasmius palmivorus TaxID=297713 RepID=A0AAW0E8S5_9AGAR